MTKEANPADVNSIDAIMKAVYDVISGDAGQKRNWDAFVRLFHKDARMIPTGQKSDKRRSSAPDAFTPEDYIKRTETGFCQRRFLRTRRSATDGNLRQYRARFFDLRFLSQVCRTKNLLRAASTVFSFSTTANVGGS